MSFPRYPAYKDSGVEWLGEVPEHWEVLPCRGIVDERTEKNEGAACQDYLSLMANVGITPYEEKGDVGNKKPEDLGKCKLVRKGNFVINSMNYGIGSYGVSGYDGVCSPVYIVLIPKEEVVRPGFAFRIFEDKTFQSYAQSFGNGILAHRCAIGWDILKGIGVPVPSSHEQERILQFLDHETAKIDALIAEQQRLIELLQEKRQAVISHAVTKGLNPHAPMKDSGVEWLGEVPEHWEVGALGYALSAIGDVDHYMPPTVAEGVPYVMTGDLEDLASEIDFTACKQISRNEYHQLCKKIKTSKGDLIVARYATIGTVSYVDLDLEFIVSYSCVTIRPKAEKAFGRFLFFCLKSDSFFQGIRERINTNTQGNVGIADLKLVKVALPPIEEQLEITVFLQTRTEEMGRVIQSSEAVIDLLQERRSALISAAVTGQIDVRGLVPEAVAA